MGSQLYSSLNLSPERLKEIRESFNKKEFSVSKHDPTVLKDISACLIKECSLSDKPNNDNRHL